MTVEELIEELKEMPPTAILVFDFEDSFAHDCVSVTYAHGEVIVRLEEPEVDDESQKREFEE